MTRRRVHSRLLPHCLDGGTDVGHARRKACCCCDDDDDVDVDDDDGGDDGDDGGDDGDDDDTGVVRCARGEEGPA